MASTPNPFAGKTLAEIAATLDATPASKRERVVTLVRSELQARIDRPNARPGSVKRAEAALARLTDGASVAIPARPEKAPAEAKPRPNNARPAARTIPGDELTLNEAIAIARKHGYPIARHWGALAKAGTLAVK